MLSDDVYKSRLRETVAALESWLDGLRRHAAVEIARDAATWRVAARPHAGAACPFELVLRNDQKYDIAIGPETYEDIAIDDLAQIQPLLSSIVKGEVVTSSWSTAGTGAQVLVATRIVPRHGKRWFRSRAVRELAEPGDAHLIRDDRHYAPYARGA